MADVFDKAKRSEVMSRIRSRDNKATELRLMELFKQNKITGWRRHLSLPGKPDFAFKKEKVAVFVDGCFWHGCPRHCKMPDTNAEFWLKKLSGNKTRDKKVNAELKGKGWKVVRIWECQLAKNPGRCIRRIRNALAAPPVI